MHGHLNVSLSRCTVTWTSVYHDARSPESQFITMQGHLNVSLSRCTVTWTSVYHDARSPERQTKVDNEVIMLVEHNSAYGSSCSTLLLSVVANLKEAALAPRAPDCRLCQISGAPTPLLSPFQPPTLSRLNFLLFFFLFFHHSTLAHYYLLVPPFHYWFPSSIMRILLLLVALCNCDDKPHRTIPVAGIAGSNPAGVMDVRILWVLCVVR